MGRCPPQTIKRNGTLSLVAFKGNDVIDDENDEDGLGVGEPTRWRA